MCEQKVRSILPTSYKLYIGVTSLQKNKVFPKTFYLKASQSQCIATVTRTPKV